MENITVADYYYRQYGIRLKFPNMPLVVSGGGRKETAMPLELFAIVPGMFVCFCDYGQLQVIIAPPNRSTLDQDPP